MGILRTVSALSGFDCKCYSLFGGGFCMVSVISHNILKLLQNGQRDWCQRACASNAAALFDHKEVLQAGLSETQHVLYFLPPLYKACQSSSSGGREKGSAKQHIVPFPVVRRPGFSKSSTSARQISLQNTGSKANEVAISHCHAQKGRVH